MKRKNSNVLKLKNFFTINTKVKELYSKFKRKISKYKKNKSFVVAVSGGPDSMALATLCKYLLYEKKLTIKGAILEFSNFGGQKKIIIDEIKDLIHEIKKNL